MRENRTSGTVAGAPGNRSPYAGDAHSPTPNTNHQSMNTMTIDESKEIAKFEHSLSVKRIIYEKVLLGLVLVLLAYIGNIYLENYKSTLTTQRFLLESRLTALKELQASHSVLTEKTLQVLAAHTDDMEWDKQSYQLSVLDFERTLNKWKLLFSKDFDIKATRHIWFHQALGYENYPLTLEDYTFVVAVFEEFDSLTKSALLEETLGGPATVATGFTLPEWTYEDIQNSGGTKAFMDEMKDAWPQH
jgi:hypothetical protein